jgi:sialic acid synthase SpsE
MRIGHVDTDREVLVIAEIGNNHEGSLPLAEELVRRAAAAGAHAVKFQTYRTEEFVSRRDEARFRRLKSFELSPDSFGRLAALARQLGLLFLSTPLDLPSVEVLAPLVGALKIASGDNTFYPLLEAAARTGLPIILSGGLADAEQLAFSKGVVGRAWAERGCRQELAVLHCVTAYPVEPAQANLGAIRTLAERLRCTVGYSDHTLGIEAPVLAIAAGARIVEKHFTIDHHYSDFRDHQLSADPGELVELVRRVRLAATLVGDGRKVAQPCEQGIEQAVRRSIAARRDLPPGTVLAWDDLAWLRPAGGLPPGKEDLVLGRCLRQAIPAGHPITVEALEGGGRR